MGLDIRLLAKILWEPLPISTYAWRRINEFLWRLWALLAVVTFLTPLKYSIPWLAFMSVYAIVAAHLGAARADAPNETS